MQSKPFTNVSFLKFSKSVLLDGKIAASFILYCLFRVSFWGILCGAIPVLIVRKENLDLSQYIPALGIIIYIIFLPLFMTYSLYTEWSCYGRKEKEFLVLKEIANYKKWLKKFK